MFFVNNYILSPGTRLHENIAHWFDDNSSCSILENSSLNVEVDPNTQKAMKLSQKMRNQCTKKEVNYI